MYKNAFMGGLFSRPAPPPSIGKKLLKLLPWLAGAGGVAAVASNEGARDAVGGAAGDLMSKLKFLLGDRADTGPSPITSRFDQLMGKAEGTASRAGNIKQPSKAAPKTRFGQPWNPNRMENKQLPTRSRTQLRSDSESLQEAMGRLTNRGLSQGGGRGQESYEALKQKYDAIMQLLQEAGQGSKPQGQIDWSSLMS